MSIHRRVSAARERLREAGISHSESDLDARLLAQHVLGWTTERFLTDAQLGEPDGFVPHYESLVGLSIARGFTHKARELFGGPRGCSHILTLAPPPSLDPKWWAPHTGYTLAKMGMSFVTLGLAAEFGARGVAVNALWPRTIVATDALNMVPGVDISRCRKPEIVADAAHAILVKPARGFSGNFLIDEDVLRESGMNDFSAYAVDPSKPLLADLFLD